MKAKDYFEEKKSNMRELWNLSDTQKEVMYSLMEQYVALNIADVISCFFDEKLSEIADKQVHISNGCFGELDFTEGKREGFEDGLYYFRDVLLKNRVKP